MFAAIGARQTPWEAMMNPSQNIRGLSRLLPPDVKMILSQVVPLYRERARFARDAESMERAALSAVKFRFPNSSPEESALLAICLIDTSASIEAWEGQKDSLSEMGEEQQLKMQMVMDRMTKADSAASNVLKKFSEISSQIIANMK
jgi:hypothetical protein